LRHWPRFGSAAPDLLSVPEGTLLVLLVIPLAAPSFRVNHRRDLLWFKDVLQGIEGEIAGDRMARLLCVLGFLAAAMASVAAASDWTTYVNDRFGATTDIPATYKAGNEPENGDGLSFTS